MQNLLCTEGLVRARRGLFDIYAWEDLPLEMLLATLAEPGEPLKTSKKAQTRRVGPWAVKESTAGPLVGAVRLTARRARYRGAWLAAHRLYAAGVGVPRPIAYLERGLAGVLLRNTLVTEYIDPARNVEQFAEAMALRGATAAQVASFFMALAEAVNRIEAAGAYHGDLSGKNILTADGRTFHFLDLDDVDLDIDTTREMRLKNHIQLYDSFCDSFSDTLLVPFIDALLRDKEDLRVWMPEVRKGQRTRRAKTAAKWAKRGESPRREYE